jgi:hypothetical protein
MAVAGSSIEAFLSRHTSYDNAERGSVITWSGNVLEETYVPQNWLWMHSPSGCLSTVTGK